MADCTISRRGLMLASAGLATASLAPVSAYSQEHPSSDRTANPAGAAATDASAAITAWIDVFGRPTASVSVNGHGPFRFLVDTGATTTVVAARLARSIGLSPAGVTTVYGGTGQADAPMAYVDELQAGAIRRNGLRVALLDRGSMEQWDGVLGADMFLGRRLEFDIPGKSVILSESSPAPDLGAARRAAVPNVQLRNGALAQLSGWVGRVGAKLILDTGADCSIANPSLSRALMKAHRTQRRDPHASVVGVTGEKLFGEGIALPPVLLGNVMAEGAVAIAVDAPIFDVWGLAHEPALLVGVDLLSRLQRFSIDYRSRVFQATPMAMQLSNSGTATG
jgi:predicted aspartyl protease